MRAESAGSEGGKLRSHGGEGSKRGAEGKAERFPHRGSVPTSTHQAERLVCSPARAGGGWELRLWLQSDPRERTGVGCLNRVKQASASRLARRESQKRSGTAEEARNFFLPLCFLVREERGLRVPLKGAPEIGARRGYQRGPQRRA